MVLALVFTLLPVTAQGLMIGDGTSGKPYQISTAAQLAGIAGSPADPKNYVLMSDIDLSAYSDWTPIGDESSQFSGTFDGNGHIIKNLSRTTTINNMGLFGVICADGIVKNLGLTGTSVSAGSNTGGVAGKNYGLISNCYNTGSLSGVSYLGGIVGYNYGTVSGCYNSGTITGSGLFVGGVAGRNERLVSHSYNSGSVTGADKNVGGIAGYNGDTYGQTGEISNCYNVGPVSGSSCVGGIAGENIMSFSNPNGVVITKCYNTGIITAPNGYLGGITGQNYSNAHGVQLLCVVSWEYHWRRLLPSNRRS